MDLEIKEIFVSRDVRFMEDSFPFANVQREELHVSDNAIYADLDFAPYTSSESPTTMPTSSI